ncbi:MAG: hypothetical protein IT452_12970 [Planctomycetia bacterium]|nr:hypothetical protein [Planctomycetia bacterium]
MTDGERGRARRVILWALLCAGGAAVPVLASRSTCLPETHEDAAIASPAPASRPRLTPPPYAPAVPPPPHAPAVPPPPDAPALPPPLTLDDRLRSLVVG